VQKKSPEKVSPCPFCESKKPKTMRIHGPCGEDVILVFCDVCFSQGPQQLTAEMAIKTWNRSGEK
jgi:hypothetical protein